MDVSIERLFQQVMACEGIEGVTFVGGEPFDQARVLADLGGLLRGESLSVVTFTGLTLPEIQEADNPDWNALLRVTDLLIDGPFVADLADQSRPWVGSSNQGFHFLTPRYAHLKNTLGEVRNRLEIHISPNGVVKANGMLPDSMLARLFENHGLA